MVSALPHIPGAALANPRQSCEKAAANLSEVSMSSELQITDVQLGDGKEVVKGALITTHYTGTLADGSVFDSSHQRGKPFQCVIGTGRVIKGWDQYFCK